MAVSLLDASRHLFKFQSVGDMESEGTDQCFSQMIGGPGQTLQMVGMHEVGVMVTVPCGLFYWMFCPSG